MKNNQKSFLGTGWAFPPSFNNKIGSNEMVSDEKDIEQSLRIILFTTLGERIMRPDFGSNLNDSVFESIDSVTLNTLEDNIRHAILEFEPRIALNKVSLEVKDIYDGVLNINIDYTISSINVRTNIVFPYYIKEGTNITNF